MKFASHQIYTTQCLNTHTHIMLLFNIHAYIHTDICVYIFVKQDSRQTIQGSVTAEVATSDLQNSSRQTMCFGSNGWFPRRWALLNPWISQTWKNHIWYHDDVWTEMLWNMDHNGLRVCGCKQLYKFSNPMWERFPNQTMFFTWVETSGAGIIFPWPRCPTARASSGMVQQLPTGAPGMFGDGCLVLGKKKIHSPSDHFVKCFCRIWWLSKKVSRGVSAQIHRFPEDPWRVNFVKQKFWDLNNKIQIPCRNPTWA